jgi:hypothetical protein
MSKATRRTVQFADLDEVVAEARRLHADGYTRAGNWSLGQCCNHLAKGLDLTVDRYSFRLPPPLSTFNRLLFFKTSWAPVLVGKLSLPTLPGFAQTEPVDDTEGLNRLVNSVARVQAASEADLQPNPLMGSLTKDQWQTFHAIHAQRHLGFLIPNEAAENQSRSAGQTKNGSAAVHA